MRSLIAALPALAGRAEVESDDIVCRVGDPEQQQAAPRRIGVERKGFDAGIDFEPRGAGVIHEEQARPVVGREVAGADVLAVATVVGESEGAIVEEREETARTAPVLDTA